MDQTQRLKDRELENSQLKRVVAELTLDKQILAEAVRGNSFAQRIVVERSWRFAIHWARRTSPNGECARCWSRLAQHCDMLRSDDLMSRLW